MDINIQGLQQLLEQATPWGLTIGQTLAALLIAAGLIILWTMFGMVVRLAGTVFRVGCALILVFSCACGLTMVIANLVGGGLP